MRSLDRCLRDIYYRYLPNNIIYHIIELNTYTAFVLIDQTILGSNYLLYIYAHFSYLLVLRV